MAITDIGYDGTISDVEFAQMQQHSGVLVPVVCGKADLAVAINGAATLTCTVAPGSAAAPGVFTTSNATESVVFDVVSTGGQTRWDAVVLRRNWSTGVSTIVIVKGTAAASAPMVLPSGVDLTLDAGLDQVLALVQITNGQSLPTQVVDRRLWGTKKFTLPSSSALPSPTAALYGMEVETPIGERFRCLSDSGGSPAWISGTLPHISRYRSTPLTMTPSTVYTVDYNTTDVVQGGGMTYAAGVVTVAKAGIYAVNTTIHVQVPPTTGGVVIQLMKNTVIWGSIFYGAAGENESLQLSRNVVCAVGDTISVRATQTTPTNITLYGGASTRHTAFDITYLGV